MFILGLTSDATSDFNEHWGPDQQDALSNLAAEFKKAGDMIGIYLCAVVEEQVKCIREGQVNCPVEARFFLALALSRKADALHELVHGVAGLAARNQSAV